MIGTIRYKMDVLAALKLAGWSTYRLYKENVLSQSTLQKLREGKSVNMGSLATLCALLDCQPGDLLEFDMAGAVLPEEDEGEGHPMPQSRLLSYSRILKYLP